MSKFTITIKNLINNKFDFKMNTYPIFDENYRSTLNNNILNHYYENEIGFETAPLFRFYLNQTLNEIMPKYNVMYSTQKEIIEKNLLLNNVNLTEEYDNTVKGTSTSNSSNNGTSNNKNLFQDTPQGPIGGTDIENQNWATNLTLDKNTTSNTINDTSNTDGTTHYLKTIIGNNGGKFNIDILNDIKNNIMNIDLMVINELNDLFMQIF